MPRLMQVTLAPAAAVANNIAQSQTPGGAGNLVLNGAAVTNGVATLDVARRLLLTTAADETAKTFTITGTDRNGMPLTEVLAGVNNSTATTLNDFKTVTQIAVSAATAGAITFGTGGKVSSQWLPFDRIQSENLGFQVIVSGVVNYTIEHTYDSLFHNAVGPQPPGGAVAPFANPFPHSTVAAQAANKDGNYINQPITAVRVTLNSFTAPGQVVATFSSGPTISP